MIGWRPSSGPDVAARRAAMLRRLRNYFDAENVLEVDTAALSRFAVSDVHIESFSVSGQQEGDSGFLHTSPEFHMKRLLAAGYPDIYSIARVFRAGEVGRHHQPEFTMIEWYRLNFSLDDIIRDAISVIVAALDKYQITEDPLCVNYRDCFLEHMGIDPIRATSAELAATASADAELKNTLGDDRDGWLDLLLSTRIASQFPHSRLTVVRHYPASQAALARLCPDDSDVADRFEVFIGPLEIANGYVELTDAKIQAARIAGDQKLRQQRGLPRRPHDTYLIDALESGLPPCAGVAIGFERLHMVHERADHIRDVIPFPTTPGD